MNQEEEFRRLFFAFRICCPWPEVIPSARLLVESERHMTLAFLGTASYTQIKKILPSFPPPPMKIGVTGKFDKCIFLPHKRVNVAAWHVTWFDQEFDLGVYQKEVIDWLQKHEIDVLSANREFLPHVTIGRRPFRFDEWRKAFKPLPLYFNEIHLFESVGNLRYNSLWSYSIETPFQAVSENEWVIKGENPAQLYKHAVVALAFAYPRILSCFQEFPTISCLEDIEEQVEDLQRRYNRREKASLSIECSNELREAKNGFLTLNIKNSA